MELILKSSNLEDTFVTEERFFVQFKESAKKLANFLERHPINFEEMDGSEIIDFLSDNKKCEKVSCFFCYDFFLICYY